MADYWKSQPRKFCQYCKCWIADNKPSIEFHERGKNHKENVAAKISEIKKKSVQKAKQEERMGKQFAAMEEAAMKAYEEDLKRMEREAAFGPEAETTTTTAASTYQPVPTVRPAKPLLANRQKSEQKPEQKKPQKKIPKPRPPVQHPPHPQHFRAALWVEGRSSEGYTYYYNTVTGESRWDNPGEVKGEAASNAPSGSAQTSSVWNEAVSPEGHTYYYNTETGESSWEKPADYIPKKAPGSSEQKEGQEEPSNTDKAEEAVKEETSSEEPSTQAETSEQGQESTDPEIQFRKRKAEGDASADTSEATEKIQKCEEIMNQEEGNETTASEMKEEETQDETPMGRFRPPNPYGTWERIKVQKDPYANVDWQLPQVQGGEDTAAVDLPPEPKHKFKTRVITSLGDSISSTGPVAFKKKKTQNGKSRSLRQRDEDD